VLNKIPFTNVNFNVSNKIKLVNIKLTYFTALQNAFIYNWISIADNI